ncbi:MAG: ABC transporter permease [Mobilicoccus sp.]|nr:ABC transporter permease [Mobilicoccus sp.]
MIGYVARRIGWSLVTIWLISLISFFIIQAPPGDFVSVLMADAEEAGRTLSPQQIEVLRDRYALDQPWYVQYWMWISGIVTAGDFGYSFRWNRPAADVIWSYMPFTILLAGGSLILTWIIAFLIGTYSAVRRYSIGDHVATFIGFIGLSVPNFVLALVFMYVAFRYFGFAVGGLFSPEYIEADWSVGRVLDLLQNLLIPALIIATAGTAGLIRITRANLSDELSQPYVLAARARGQRESILLARYPVRAAMNPFISTIGYAIPSVLSGEIIVSTVLSLPTTGPVLLSALRNQDMYLAGSFILILGVLTVIGTVISDLVLAWADPRVRRQHSGAAS